MSDLARRIFTATLIIGPPGVGKTSLAKTFAEYLWEVYHKVLLLYSWDGGAIPNDVQKLMKQGLIRFWRARTRSAEGLGLETLYLASRGYWPRRINAITGETSPAVELVPPVSTRYAVSCPQGHALQTVPSRDLVQPVFCNACKALISGAGLTVKETVTRTAGFELVGGVFFDGLTSMTDVVMDHMDIARGAGQIGGEKPAFGGVVTSGSVRLGGNNRADVGFGQTRARQLVNNSLSIPALVEGPIFTALANEATDEGGLSIIGAKLPGQAATDQASGWFGNVFEMGKYLDDGGKRHFCLYLRPYVDAQGRRHLLKTSSTVFGLPDRLIDPPEEERKPFEQANLGLVFKLLDEDLRRACQEELAGSPGQPQEFMEYGEAAIVETAAATQQPQASGPQPLPMTTVPTAAGTTTVGAASQPMMVATPRKKRNGGAMPLAVTAAVPAPAPSSLAAEGVPDAAASAPTHAAPVAVAGVPPPPPGMKPPMKAPSA